MKGEDVRVKVDRDHVRIAGMRHAPPGRDVLRLHRMEIAFGPFERVIAVSRPFDRDSVTAHLEDGFLEITLPMPKGKRQIAVEEG